MTWKIPLAKPFFDDAEHQAVKEVLASGMVSSGKKVEEFEEVVRRYCGAKYAVAVSSCTAGLYLVLSRISLAHILMPAFTFPAIQMVKKELSGRATTHPCGINVDVDRNTCNSAGEFQIEISKIIKWAGPICLVPIHKFGLPTDMDEIRRILKWHFCEEATYQPTIIEDAACALGSEYKGERIGKRGTCVFSFHGRKILTTGEGGMICTDDEELYEKCLEGRNFGKNKAGEFVGTGLNMKMSDVHAAIGIEQIKKLPTILQKRKQIAEEYKKQLQSIMIDDWMWFNYIRLPNSGKFDYSGHNWQSYVIEILKKECVPIRDAVMHKMRAAGIEVQIGSWNWGGKSCPVSEELSRTTLALPIYPQMTSEDIKKVVEELERCLRSSTS